MNFNLLLVTLTAFVGSSQTTLIYRDSVYPTSPLPVYTSTETPVKKGPCCPYYSFLCPKPCSAAPITTTTTAKPIELKPSPCLPPTCYTDYASQEAEINKIFKDASHSMVEYSDKATRPVIYVAQTINSGVELIPSIFSASGDMLGKAIAGPIQFINRLGFSLLSGAISQVVTIPISVSTQVRASSVLLQPYLRWFGVSGLPYGCCDQPATEPSKQIGLRPVGIITGPIDLAVGSVLNMGGSTFRLIGTMTKAGGEAVESTGMLLKNMGSFKVADGITSVASALEKIGKGGDTICIDDGKKLAFYANETKKPDSYATTAGYVPTTTAPMTTVTQYVPVTTPYVPTVKTTPYVTAPVVEYEPSTQPSEYLEPTILPVVNSEPYSEMNGDDEE